MHPDGDQQQERHRPLHHDQRAHDDILSLSVIIVFNNVIHLVGLLAQVSPLQVSHKYWAAVLLWLVSVYSITMHAAKTSRKPDLP